MQVVLVIECNQFLDRTVSVIAEALNCKGDMVLRPTTCLRFDSYSGGFMWWWIIGARRNANRTIILNGGGGRSPCSPNAAMN